MRISYKPLFSIECRHGYFADRVCRTLVLSPTAAAARLCERHHLRFRASPGGGTVYYEESAARLSRLRDETAPLSFVLSSTDPLFEIYTDGGAGGNASPHGTVHYFSNRGEHAADVKGQPRPLLHPPGQPFGQPPLTVRSSRFTWRFDQPVQATALAVLNSAGQPVWATETPASPVRDWPIDLRDQPSGRYALRIGNIDAGDFYLSDESIAAQWGVVDILPALIDQPITYAISFASRQTVLRYYLFEPQAESSYAGYEVVGLRKRSAGANGSGNGEIGFSRRPETVTVNERLASVFESAQPVPLAEIPSDDDYLFTFRPSGAGRGGPPIKLPFAQPVTTKPDAGSGGTRMVCDIFVYL